MAVLRNFSGACYPPQGKAALLMGSPRSRLFPWTPPARVRSMALLLRKSLFSSFSKDPQDLCQEGAGWILTSPSLSLRNISYRSSLLLTWNSDTTPYAGKDWRQEKEGPTENEMVGWYYWLSGHDLSKLREMVKDRQVWRAGVNGVTKSQTRLSDWRTADAPRTVPLRRDRTAVLGADPDLRGTIWLTPAGGTKRWSFILCVIHWGPG